MSVTETKNAAPLVSIVGERLEYLWGKVNHPRHGRESEWRQMVEVIAEHVVRTMRLMLGEAPDLEAVLFGIEDRLRDLDKRADRIIGEIEKNPRLLDTNAGCGWIQKRLTN